LAKEDYFSFMDDGAQGHKFAMFKVDMALNLAIAAPLYASPTPMDAGFLGVLRVD
jgi:hypothetical protein